MSVFSSKLNTIANDTNFYLINFFSKQKKNSYLLKPMKYGIFSGGKRFRSAIVLNTGRIYDIDYKKLRMLVTKDATLSSVASIENSLKVGKW